MLDSRAARLSGYWSAFLKELGAESVLPALSAAEALALGQQSLEGEPVTVQLALGRILSLEHPDLVVVPEWPTVSGDAWGEALTELLPRRISGLPPLVSVPDESHKSTETAATELGLRLTHNAGQVRLALDKVRPLLSAPRSSLPNLSRASQATVAVIGPRTLLNEDALAAGLRPALEALELYPVFSTQLPLPDIVQRAERMENAAKVPAGERELFGAASLIAGKSAVRGLILVSPARDRATAAALERLAQKMHKPTLLLSADGGQTEWPELPPFSRRLTPSPSATDET